ncbi:MAG: outer membrane beta-barrel protein [Bryobacteraceae bacterium]
MTCVKQLLVLSLLLAFAGVASAQILEFGVGGGASRLSNNTLAVLVAGPPELRADLMSGWRLNFRLGINPYSHFGYEAGYSYVRSNLDYAGQEVKAAAHQGTFAMLAYLTPEGTRVRPFFAGGAQFSTFPYPGYSVSQGANETKFGINYGTGIKAKVTDRWLIRLDFRQYLSPKPDFGLAPQKPEGWLRMNEISMGFSFYM